MTKITFTDKVNAIDPGLPAINVWDATNANEVKTVVNANDDRLITAEAEILTGWQPLGATLTYSSADSPTWVVGSSVDLTGKVQKGNRLYLEQAQALTSYFTFDNNSTDAKGILTTTDTAMTYTAGKFSNAATFNGTTSKIVGTDTANWKPTGPFTIGCWFKTATTGTIKFLVQSKSGTKNGFYLYISANNQVNFSIGDGTVGETAVAPNNVCDDKWHYAVGTYNNNVMQIYIDGQLFITKYAPTPAYTTNYIRIGCGNEVGTDIYFMNGQIDDLFFINGYALDGETIFQKYLLGTAQGSGNITVKKKFIVSDLSKTTMTIYGGTDNQLANATISNPYFSQVKQPFGFNTNPDKWSLTLSSTSNLLQSSPVQNTWYNLGSLNIQIPIGVWDVDYSLYQRGYRGTSGLCKTQTSLSTSTSSGNTDLLTVVYGNPMNDIGLAVYTKQRINLSSSTTYYLITRTDVTGMGDIGYDGSTQKIKIRAVCAYL